MAHLLAAHHDAVQRLAEVPGWVSIAPPGKTLRKSALRRRRFRHGSKHFASWMGACPGTEESAGKNYSHRCPKGNRQMRRVLNQAANAAVKAPGHHLSPRCIADFVPRLGHAQAIGAITHRLCRLIWKILHERVRYEERRHVSAPRQRRCARADNHELRSLGYRVELISPAPSASAIERMIFDPG